MDGLDGYGGQVEEEEEEKNKIKGFVIEVQESRQDGAQD